MNSYNNYTISSNKTPEFNDSRLDSALKYAEFFNWKVFPLHTIVDGRCTCGRSNCTSPGKHPRTENGVKDATTDAETIKGWWSKWPDSNIGIATGNGLVVLDVDPRHGGDESIEDIEIPETVQVLTGGGGRHYYFEYDGAIGNRTNIKPGLDIRGQGGYVVAPPSNHVSGGQYEWELSSIPGETPLADCPKWITENKKPTTSVEPIPSTIKEGSRNDSLTSLAGSMRRRGASQDSVLAALMAENKKCVPPLKDDELQKIAASICRYEPEKNESEPTEWPEVIPLSAYNVPAFPVDCLPDWLQRYVTELSTATQTPIDLSGMLSLTVIATAVAHKVEIMPHEGWREPVNIYTVTALPPASRKSAVFAECTLPLVEYEKGLRNSKATEVRAAQNEYKALEQALQQAQTAKAKALATGKEIERDMIGELSERLESFEVPVMPRLVADDSTLESIASLLAEHQGRIAIMSAEGDLFDILAGRYSSGNIVNIGIVLKGHSGDFVRVDRIGRGSISVDSPALTIGLAVQPDVLKGLVQRPGFRGRGLLGRFLYSLPSSNIGHRLVSTRPLSDITRQRYCNKIESLLDLPLNGSVNILLMDDASKNKFIKFETWLEPELGEGGELASIADWAGKLAGAIARIAALLHMAVNAGDSRPWEQRINADTVKNAIQIGKYLIEHAKAAFDIMGDNEDIEAAKTFLRWIDKTGTREFKKRDLFQSVKGSFPKVEMLDAGLSILIDYGYIREKASKKNKAGRPSMIFEVNPGYDSHYSQNTQKPLARGSIEDIEDIEKDIPNINLLGGEF